MIPTEIFHYTKRETALEKILFDKRIRLGQIGLTNDPRESKARYFSLSYQLPLSGSKLSTEQTWAIMKEADTLVGNEWKVFCVSQHHPDYNYDMEGVMSPFLRGDCRPRMWATYAESHKGVCLKFNGSKLDQRVRDELGDKCKIFCGSVEYDDLKVMLPSYPIDLEDIDKLNSKKAIRDYCLENWEELFLLKSKDWETEFEYRWLVYSATDAPEYISIDGIIEGVLVGQDFPRVYFPSLIELCKDLNIPAGIIEWRNGVSRHYYENIYKP